MKSNFSREERQRIVTEYLQSGKSQTVFAPEYGIELFKNVFDNENRLRKLFDEEKISEAELLER